MIHPRGEAKDRMGGVRRPIRRMGARANVIPFRTFGPDALASMHGRLTLLLAKTEALLAEYQRILDMAQRIEDTEAS